MAGICGVCGAADPNYVAPPTDPTTQPTTQPTAPTSSPDYVADPGTQNNDSASLWIWILLMLLMIAIFVIVILIIQNKKAAGDPPAEDDGE